MASFRSASENFGVNQKATRPLSRPVCGSSITCAPSFSSALTASSPGPQAARDAATHAASAAAQNDLAISLLPGLALGSPRPPLPVSGLNHVAEEPREAPALRQ